MASVNNLANIFDNILKTWGRDIYLQRRILFDGSGVYTDASNNSFSTQLEKWTIRSFYSRHSGLPSTVKERGEGMVHTPEVLYYFPGAAKPKEGDRIYEKDDRYPGGQTTLIISYAQPVFGVNSQIVFWECGVLRENPQ